MPAFIAEAARTRREPPGFGHRVYRTYDPRARILREHASQVFAVTGRPRIFETALALEEAAAKDAYFIEQALYPTVDFYETIIYHAIGFPPEMFPVLFAIPRFVGWAAQWNEMMSDARTTNLSAAPALHRARRAPLPPHHGTCMKHSMI